MEKGNEDIVTLKERERERESVEVNGGRRRIFNPHAFLSFITNPIPSKGNSTASLPLELFMCILIGTAQSFFT